MEAFAETPNGLLFIVNGLDLAVKWDGLSTQVDTVGVSPPAAAVTVAGSGTGAIVGTYFAYLRFVDADGNYSNLSPISAEYEAEGDTGSITGATSATPIVITSTLHGLTTGDIVKITGVGGNTSANNTWTVTVVDADTFSLDSSTGTAGYTGSGTWQSGVDTITYTAVEVPALAKVKRRQILRNTDGQTDTFYVDVDTTDLVLTTFSSTKDDDTLSLEESQAILDIEGLPLANSRTVPPNHKAYVASHLDRMFLAGEVEVKSGHIKVTFGSTTVTGVGTSWTESLADRFLHIVKARRTYEIASVNTAAQALTLEDPYEGATDNFAIYAIRPPPAERKIVYFSQAGEYESWPATNGVTLQDDGDEITGLMVRNSFIYILERRHIYRLTFQDNPLTDGAVFLDGNRGCVNNRCYAVADDTAFMLDEQGVHAFGNEPTSVSEPIQELFRPGGNSEFTINWRAKEHFHAVHSQPQEVIRWFVCLSGECAPRHALAYSYRLKRWWVEEYPYPITASCSGRLRGIPEVYLGATARRVFAFWEGHLDGPSPDLGTVRGTATSGSLMSLTDTTAAFAADVVGAPLVLADGTGKGQRRIITARTATALTVGQPWTVRPDSTTVYQVGGIPWKYRTGWLELSPGTEDFQDRGIELVFQKTALAATMDIRVRYDFAPTPEVWRTPIASAASDGIRVDKNLPDMVVDLAVPKGLAHKRIPGHRENWISGCRQYVQVELGGVSNQEAQALYQMIYLGAMGGGDV